MRWVVLALAGCNQVYGLEATRLGDAEITVHGCPATGTPPRFSRIITQRIAQRCTDYSASAERAVALCDGVLSEGAPDAPMLGPIALTGSFHHPRLAPDGVTLFAYEGESTGTLVALARAGDGTWQRATTLPFAVPDLETVVSEPTADPPRRVLVSSLHELHEYVEEPDGTWTEIPPVASDATFGVVELRNVHLSADGLRMVVEAFPELTNRQPQIYYADRARVTERFERLTRLELPPGVEHAFLASDCSRVHFSALDFVLSVEQL